ncbi:13264_t:CDS:2, partial [Gigaspora margarita]
NTRKINLGTIKIQLLGVIGTVKLINKTDNNETTQYILQQLQGLTDIIQQDLHMIEITGELPNQHTDRFVEENQEPDLSQYNLATSQDSIEQTINEMKQTIIMIYFIKEKTPLQERFEGYLEQKRKNYPELDQYIKNKEWNNQQYDLPLTSNIYKYNPLNQQDSNTKGDYIEITEKKAYNKWIKEEKEKERNEETREIIIVKNWKYEYPREQFEETEENITDLMIKEHDNFELSDLRARIKLAKNKCLQHYLSTLKIRRLRKIVQPPTKKELREKMNNIFDKPLQEGILKNLNQDPYTSKSIPIRVQPLTRNEVKFTEAKLPFNKSYEPTNISLFNGPLFNQLTLMKHLEESLYIRIAANKKNQLTEEQYQDWQQQMFQKIEKQYNTLYNEERQFSLKNIMRNQIKEEYNNLHEMLNHDQLKLNFIAIDGAIALKTWLQSYKQNVILREEITLQHKDLLKMFYANPEKYGFALQLTIINEWNMMYQQLH